MATKKSAKGPKNDEIVQRRKEVAAELKAREAARKAAWEEKERAHKEAEERRKAQEPDKEFARAARLAKERAEKERIDLHRGSYDKEAANRNPDAALEKKFRTKHAKVFEQHLAAWARLQDSMGRADDVSARTALTDMARAWREKEDLILALKAGTKGKSAESSLESRTATLAGRLEALEESRKKAMPKPAKKRRPKRDRAE